MGGETLGDICLQYLCWYVRSLYSCELHTVVSPSYSLCFFLSVALHLQRHQSVTTVNHTLRSSLMMIKTFNSISFLHVKQELMLETSNLIAAVFYCVAAHYIYNLSYHKRKVIFRSSYKKRCCNCHPKLESSIVHHQ